MKWSDLSYRSAHESVGELEQADPWFRDPFFRGMVGGEEGVWEELDTAMGSGGALSRQNHGRGLQRDAGASGIDEFDGSERVVFRGVEDAVGGSTFSAVY